MAKIYRGKKGKRLTMVRVSRIEEADREFDIEFWQSLGTKAIFDAAWELVVDTYIHKGGKKSELRLQRTVTRFSKIRRKKAARRLQDKADISAFEVWKKERPAYLTIIRDIACEGTAILDSQNLRNAVGKFSKLLDQINIGNVFSRSRTLTVVAR